MAATITPVAKTPAPGRTVQGTITYPAQAPAQQIPAGYQLMYQMGGPRYMYGETPFYGARYADGGIVPGQIYGNMRGSREGADMFGFFPTMFQSQPYATASQMYTPSLGVMPLIGYPSKYPHVVMGGYTDYGAPIANQAINMMLPLLMMGLYRQMFPMQPQAPAAAAKGAGGGRKGGGGSGGGSDGGSVSGAKAPDNSKYEYMYHYPGEEAAWKGHPSPGGGAGRDLVGPYAPDNYEGNGLYYFPNEGYIRRDQTSGYPGGPLHKTAPDLPPLAPPAKSNVPWTQRWLGIGAADVPAAGASASGAVPSPSGQAKDAPVFHQGPFGSVWPYHPNVQDPKLIDFSPVRDYLAAGWNKFKFADSYSPDDAR